MRYLLILLILFFSSCANFHATASVGWSDHGVETKSTVESNSTEGVEA
jgi:hypothetical protein